MPEAQTENADAVSEAAETAPLGTEQGSARRERSTIEFPYTNLEDAEEAAEAIFAEAGMAEVSLVQAAGLIGTTADSSTFRVKLSAMRLFGLVSSEQQRVALTALGREICDISTRAKARVDAFLNIPLYAKLVQQHEGRILPPVAALDREIVALGVGQKVADRARQAFDKSAKHAGFIKAGSDRFMTPIVNGRTPVRETTPNQHETPHRQPGGGGGGDDDGVDPVIKALVAKIPPTGTQWPLDEQVYLLQMLAMTFHMTYKNRRPIKVVAETEAGAILEGMKRNEGQAV